MAFVTKIAVTQPFDFDLTLRYLQTSPSTVIERSEGRVWQRAIRLEGRPYLAQVTSSGTITAPQLTLKVLGAEPSEAQRAAAVALVRRLFDVEAPADEFYMLAAADPVFGPVAARWRGLRPVLIADPFETLVWAIIGQQINVRFAARLKAALVDEYGGSLTVNGERFPLFPEPAVLAAASGARLRELQFSRQKIDYILRLSEAAASGSLDLAALATLPPEDALRELMTLRGIGRWTAEYVLLRGFGHRDAFPAGDGGLRRAVGQWYGLGRLATEDQVRRYGAAWAPWRGYAAIHWWFALQQGLRPDRLASVAPSG